MREVGAWLRARCGATPPAESEVFTVRDGAGEIEGALIFSHWYVEDGRPIDAEWTLEIDRPATPAIIRAALRYAFDRLGLERLTVHPRHERSQALAEWIGFQYEGTRRGDQPRLMYGMTADEYRASRWAPRGEPWKAPSTA